MADGTVHRKPQMALRSAVCCVRAAVSSVSKQKEASLKQSGTGRMLMFSRITDHCQVKSLYSYPAQEAYEILDSPQRGQLVMLIRSSILVHLGEGRTYQGNLYLLPEMCLSLIILLLIKL
jgi:hypothetical protein